MTIPVSTIPAVKAQLVTSIAANATIAADPTIAVLYDGPASGSQADDIVSVGNVTREIPTSAMVGSGGTGWLEEIYSVEITVSVFRPSQNSQLTFERCCALTDCVIDVIRTDPSLNHLVIVARPVSADYLTEWSEDGGGQFAICHLHVRCHARL